MSFYAVRKGHNPGIYTDWNTCSEQVTGFKNAEFKKFKTQEEAEAFMNNGSSVTSDPGISLVTPYAFVDGSFNPKTHIFGYGGFLVIDENSERIVLNGSDDKPEYISMRNVAGEIYGSVAAIKKAIELGLKEITIYYDYMGIEMWANGSWKANQPGTINYQNFIKEAEKKISIRFTKVTAHTGIPGNEDADRLAKQAVGIS